MTRTVRVSLAVRRDLQRLADFVVEKNIDAASKAAEATLRRQFRLEISERGAPASGRVGVNWVRFGRNAYVIRYRVEVDVVFVTRVFHRREHC